MASVLCPTMLIAVERWADDPLRLPFRHGADDQLKAAQIFRTKGVTSFKTV